MLKKMITIIGLESTFIHFASTVGHMKNSVSRNRGLIGRRDLEQGIRSPISKLT